MAPVPAYAQHEPAPAGAPSPDAVQRADALFRSANQLYTQQKWAEAEAAFLAAWALNPTYDVAANLGHTQFKLQKYRDAAEHLSFALRNWPLIGKPEPRKLAQDRLDEARRFVAAVTVSVSEPGADVFVDGILVGHSPMVSELFVEPGTRVIEARLQGRGDAKQVVQAAKGAASTVTLTLQRPGGGSPPPGGKSVPLLATGIGVAAVGVGLGIAGVVASANNSSSFNGLRAQLAVNGTNACNPPTNPACDDLRSKGIAVGSFRNLGIVGFTVGGAAAVATVVYVLLPTSSTKATPVKAGFLLAPGGGGATLTGNF
jgi:hypothetical protein